MSFIDLCKRGKFDKAVQLYNLGSDNIHGDRESAFKYSCANGYFGIAKWSYGSGTNIHTDGEYAFIWTFRNS